jgi:hypothetical protein
MPRIKFIDQGQPDDTEGNGLRGNVEADATEDTDGNAAKFRGVSDETEDDTEGNMSRGRG